MLGVVADDLTGALDAALLLHAGGTAVPVIVGVEPFRRQGRTPPAVILDVDSRGDPPEAAYRKVREAARALMDAGYTRFYKKMSSTFQGHIGREVDALLDETAATFAIVVPAFPANGRTTRLGYLYVDGVPLAETGVGRHPTSPIIDSYLPRVLQAQTRRPVHLVDFQTVRRGAAALSEEFQRLSHLGGMALVDVTTEGELEVVAEAAGSLKVTSGGSALAGKLPLPEERVPFAPPLVPAPLLPGCLLLAGSVSPVTAAQVAFALRTGLPGLRLEVLALLDPDTRDREVERAAAFALGQLRRGANVLVYTPSEPETQARARDLGTALGIDPMRVGMIIAEGQAEVAARVVAQTGLNRLLVAGGDTSSAVCRRLGLEVHRVLEEIQTGIPLSLSAGRQTMVTVLKSGNFGTEDFFTRAVGRVCSPFLPG